MAFIFANFEIVFREYHMFQGKQNKKIRKLILSFLFIVIIVVPGYYLFVWLMEQRAGFAHYPGFGIKLPIDFAIHGIDVSHHQDVIKWEAVKDMKVNDVQLGFSFIKATEGYSRVDWQYKRNWKKAKEVGLVRGAYHFFLPNKNGKIQADNFIATVKLEKGDLPPVLDVEETYGVQPVNIRKRVKEWLQTVEKHYGIKPILYTNVDYYKNYLGSEFDDYPLWVAHYISRNKPRIKRNWIFWQHNETGRVNGILAKVDFNVFNGDSTSFRSLLFQ
jgi:lysozyme